MTIQIRTIEEYKEVYRQSVEDPEKFWDEQARSFEWYSPWQKVLEWDFHEGMTKWFMGGKTNITVNCLDRHLESNAEQAALIWEPNEPDKPSRRFTYRELYSEVCRFCNALKVVGVRKGDRVCIYMPMVPELVIAILGCARMGAVHSVVFAGFSASSLAERIKDASCKWVICSDFNNRGPKSIPVKSVVDEAISLGCDCVQNVIVHRNTGAEVLWHEKRDVWWHNILEGQPDEFPAEIMDSEDMLFILYTSGSTGRPKGVVHTCGGYMVYASYSFKNVFQYQKDEIFWCTADIGWITGHTYLIYGPLLSGATTLMFEGTPFYPDPSRLWKIIDKHQVRIFYTAPTAIRALMAEGDEFTQGHDLNSLRVLGSVGEPINAEAWHWFHDKIGKGKTPLVDTWWQTETGGTMITPLAGVTDNKPCYASYPLPGVQPILVDSNGKEITDDEIEGLLCIKYPWPSIIRTTYGDHDRCRKNYFGQFPGMYFTGDGAKRDREGRYRIIGRVDDVINVSGHRIGTAEVENAINEHPLIVESAVVAVPHAIKGSGIFAYVIAKGISENESRLFGEINQLLRQSIGGFACVDHVKVVPGLPKTRSGKIMRRILRKIAEGNLQDLGDISTLVNPEVVDEILLVYHQSAEEK